MLERIVGRTLTPQQVHALRERTEGWAAGLQLAGLHLRHAPDADAFIAEFTGSDRLVADYLGEEVLAALPPHRRRLLLALSALDDMSGELVEATTGAVDGQGILEQLEHDNMFLVPLDTHRRWFRFHHLFSDLLRSRLRAEDPAEELRILTAAADWHLARGRMRLALDYLLRAQARDGAMEAMIGSAAAPTANDLDGSARVLPRLEDALGSAPIDEQLFAGVREARGDERDRADAEQCAARLGLRRRAGAVARPPGHLGRCGCSPGRRAGAEPGGTRRARRGPRLAAVARTSSPAASATRDSG